MPKRKKTNRLLAKWGELFWRDVVKGKRRGWLAVAIRGILHVLSWPFGWLVGMRNWAFDRELLKRYYPPVPVVVSIGNIVMGGTGKTPVTLMLAREFCQDFRVAILSRGYRSVAERLPSPTILCKEGGIVHSPEFCGDEPYLFAENLPQATIFVGRNRRQASIQAAEKGMHLILLDDGMQHRSLARDFEVVVVDATDPFGRGHLFPRGFLREKQQELKRADLVILNHVSDQEHFFSVKEKIQKETSAPVVGVAMKIVQVLDVNNAPLPSLEGKSVAIFCGIANPEHFRTLVQKQNAHIVAEYFCPDHLLPKPRALARFAAKSKQSGAELLLCTEKDRVKLSGKREYALPIAWTRADLHLLEGEEHWQEFLGKTRDKLEQSLVSI